MRSHYSVAGAGIGRVVGGLRDVFGALGGAAGGGGIVLAGGEDSPRSALLSMVAGGKVPGAIAAGDPTGAGASAR